MIQRQHKCDENHFTQETHTTSYCVTVIDLVLGLALGFTPSLSMSLVPDLALIIYTLIIMDTKT